MPVFLGYRFGNHKNRSTEWTTGHYFVTTCVFGSETLTSPPLPTSSVPGCDVSTDAGLKSSARKMQGKDKNDCQWSYVQN